MCNMTLASYAAHPREDDEGGSEEYILLNGLTQACGNTASLQAITIPQMASKPVYAGGNIKRRRSLPLIEEAERMEGVAVRISVR